MRAHTGVALTGSDNALIRDHARGYVDLCICLDGFTSGADLLNPEPKPTYDIRLDARNMLSHMGSATEGQAHWRMPDY